MRRERQFEEESLKAKEAIRKRMEAQDEKSRFSEGLKGKIRAEKERLLSKKEAEASTEPNVTEGDFASTTINDVNNNDNNNNNTDDEAPSYEHGTTLAPPDMTLSSNGVFAAAGVEGNPAVDPVPTVRQLLFDDGPNKSELADFSGNGNQPEDEPVSSSGEAAAASRVAGENAANERGFCEKDSCNDVKSDDDDAQHLRLNSFSDIAHLGVDDLLRPRTMLSLCQLLGRQLVFNIEKPISLILIGSTIVASPPSDEPIDFSVLSAACLGILLTLSVLATFLVHLCCFQEDWVKERLRDRVALVSDQLYVERNLHSSSVVRVEELTAEKSKLASELERRSRGVLVQSDELDELRHGNDELHREVSFKETEIQDLTEQLERKKSALNETESRLAERDAECRRLDGEMTTLTASLGAAETREKTLIEEATANRQESARRDKRLEEKETQWAAAEEGRKATKTRLEEAKEELAEMERSCAEATSLAEESQGELTKLQEDILMRDQEIAVLRDFLAKAGAFDRKAAGKKGEEEEEEGEIEEEEEEVSEAEYHAKVKQLMDVGTARVELDVIKEDRDRLSSSLQVERDARASLETELAQLRARLSELSAERETASSMQKEAVTKLEILSTYFRDKELEMQRRLGEQELVKKHTENLAQSAQESIGHHEEQLRVYREQTEELKEEIQAVERKYKSLVSQQETKAHENWVAARKAERELKEAQHELSTLRQSMIKQHEGLIRPIPSGGIAPATDADAKSDAGSLSHLP